MDSRRRRKFAIHPSESRKSRALEKAKLRQETGPAAGSKRTRTLTATRKSDNTSPRTRHRGAAHSEHEEGESVATWLPPAFPHQALRRTRNRRLVSLTKPKSNVFCAEGMRQRQVARRPDLNTCAKIQNASFPYRKRKAFAEGTCWRMMAVLCEDRTGLWPGA